MINQIPNWLLPELTAKATKLKNRQRFSEPGVTLGLLTLLVAMLLWNWKLLLALLVGISIMLMVYSMPKWNWRSHWREIQQFLDSPNRQLILAVGSGGIATLITYMAAAIWVESPSHWLAAGVIVQGCGTLLTLILLVWQIVNFHSHREDNKLEKLLLDLTAKDPIKRLITVRQLTKILNRQNIDPELQQDILQCLHLLLSQEEEVAIREAAFASLQNFERSQLPSTPLPNLMPLTTKVKARVSM